MAPSHSDKEWLRKNIKDGNIRFYSFDDFTGSICIGEGGYGVVFKAEMKTLGRTVAYKLLHSQNQDEMFENLVKEVRLYNDGGRAFFFVFDIIVNLIT